MNAVTLLNESYVYTAAGHNNNGKVRLVTQSLPASGYQASYTYDKGNRLKTAFEYKRDSSGQYTISNMSQIPDRFRIVTGSGSTS